MNMERVDEIMAMPVGTKLQPLGELHGFSDWSESPVTREILARLEAKARHADADAAALKPCSCGAPQTPDARERIGFEIGIAGGMRALGVSVSNALIPATGPAEGGGDVTVHPRVTVRG